MMKLLCVEAWLRYGIVEEGSNAREVGTHITVIAEAKGIGVCFVLTKGVLCGILMLHWKNLQDSGESTR
jgi:hypothetical protein